VKHSCQRCRTVFISGFEYAFRSYELSETYNRPPGYPVFLAGIHAFFGETILAIRKSVMGALLTVVIAVIGKRIGGEVVEMLCR